MAAFKKLVLEIASTLQQHKNSKYIKFKIKPSEQRLFANMALKHLTKAGNSQLCVSGDYPAHHKGPPALPQWVCSWRLPSCAQWVCSWRPPSCAHRAPSPECRSARWHQARIFSPSTTSITRLSILPPCILIIQLNDVLYLCFCSIHVISFLP